MADTSPGEDITPADTDQAEKDRRVKEAWDAYENGRTVKDDQGRKRPKPQAEILPLWEALWHACDFSWEGLADTGWARGDDANFAQRLKQWQAPVGFPGNGPIHGKGNTAWREASLQEYWRWSDGVPGFEGENRLLTDEELRDANLLVTDGDVERHALHCAHLHAIVAIHGDADASDLHSANANAAAKTRAEGEALGAVLLARLQSANDYEGEGPDTRSQSMGARAQGLDAAWRAFKASSLEAGDASPALIHLCAPVSRFEKIDAEGLSFGQRALFTAATFGDQAVFYYATFGNEASFDDATFRDQARFGSATFRNEANFDAATFENEANFDDATFGDQARFRSATFGNEASFYSATFGDQARFSSATFGKKAVFYYATFGNKAGFFRATFRDQANFSSATFGDRARFFTAIFGDKASFSSATFGDQAYFGSTIFGNQADFGSATFGNQAYFGSTFGNQADFGYTTFGDQPDFGSTTFGDQASFSKSDLTETRALLDAKLGKEADFEGSRFPTGQVIIFDDHNSINKHFGALVVASSTSFQNATFDENTKILGKAPTHQFAFRRCQFSGLVDFKELNWDRTHHYAGVFEGARFRDVADFSSASFSAFAAFVDATFESTLLLSEAKNPDDMFGQACTALKDRMKADKELIGATDYKPNNNDDERTERGEDARWSQLSGGYRTAKKAMEAQGDFERAQRYYRFEVKTRVKKPSTNGAEKFAAWAYGQASDYGASIGRPILTLGGFFLVFTLIFALVAALVPSGPTRLPANVHASREAPYLHISPPLDIERLVQAAEFSLNNAFRPLSALSTQEPRERIDADGCDRCSLSDMLLFHPSGWVRLPVKALAVVQSLLSFILAFLFGLSVRRKFQIS